MKKKYLYSIVALLLLIMFLLGIGSIWNDSATNDEVAHIPAGYSYLKRLDYRLNPEHPPLIKDLAALPLLFLKLNANFQDQTWLKADQWSFGRNFLYKWGNNADLIVFLSRLPVIILMIILGIYIFIWSKKIWGEKAALLSLFLYTFSPTVLAHGRLVTTDLGIAFFFFVTLYYFWHFLKKPSLKYLILTGLFFGLAQLTKFSAILLVPLMIFITLIFIWINDKPINFLTLNKTKSTNIRRFLQPLISLIIIFLTGFFLVFVTYLIQTKNLPIDLQQKIVKSSLDDGWVKDIIYYLSGIPIIRSFAYFILGLAMASGHTISGHTTYFLGQLANGWWYYFPIIFLMKETIPVLLFFIAGLIMIINASLKLIKQSYLKYKRKKKNFLSILYKDKKSFYFKYFDDIYLLAPVILFFVIGFFSSLNIGVRYFLPIYPFLFILFGGIFYYFNLKIILYEINQRKPTGNFLFFYYVFIFFILAWQFAACGSICPHFLAYFNPLVGGPRNAYHYVVDSNLDWGQDLKRLKLYLADKKIEKIYLNYFGHASPSYYGINYIPFGPENNNIKGYVACSATALMSTRPYLKGGKLVSFEWLQNQEPIDSVGYSILIYKLK